MSETRPNGTLEPIRAEYLRSLGTQASAGILDASLSELDTTASVFRRIRHEIFRGMTGTYLAQPRSPGIEYPEKEKAALSHGLSLGRKRPRRRAAEP